MTTLQPDQLWYPGQAFELAAEYPTPSDEELLGQWQAYTADQRSVTTAPGVYGAIAMPDIGPTLYASIDLCEVVRETHHGLRLLEEPVLTNFGSIHDYCSGLTIANEHDITSAAQVLINGEAIPPVEEIDDIAEILRGWRQEGVYVFANTSTLPGCEPGTITFMQRYLPECFDGLLLPRNHDSSLPLTKGVAARMLINHLSPETADIRAVHIDDKAPHNTAFHNEIAVRGIARAMTFQPDYATHCAPSPANCVITETPLEAFQAAEQYLLS